MRRSARDALTSMQLRIRDLRRWGATPATIAAVLGITTACVVQLAAEGSAILYAIAAQDRRRRRLTVQELRVA